MKTLLTAIVFSAAALAWSWNWYWQSQKNYVQFKAQFETCNGLASKILKKREQISNVGFAPKNYDYAQDVIRLLSSCDISTDKGVSLAGSRTITSGADVAKKAIANPIADPITVNQVVLFLSAAPEGEVGYFVESIELSAPPKRSTAHESETWVVSDLDLSFFELESAR